MQLIASRAGALTSRAGSLLLGTDSPE